ncbi:hypothetical protein [Corynebacterium marinum]|uniref:Uncharacterized protein n=1 Tax=Corynebacterium marinum DSM 44953 TaxID=1224162 RepID=A0A0B6TM51_9CORY|nr:hypothetical protein [Corynebacterium marinum]AJK69018.1 hypothetical protein B840_07065 [Corynebacterium marinum DSM 44953]GGO20301.1 hypothetical protein GCM10010980_20430 [Corynebacterium marinum]
MTEINYRHETIATEACDADFRLKGAGVYAPDKVPTTFTWTTVGTAPADQQVTYGVTHGGKDLLVRVTGSTVEQVSYFDGERNRYVDPRCEISENQISVGIPVEVSSIFESKWIADLHVDGEKVNRCEYPLAYKIPATWQQ